MFIPLILLLLFALTGAASAEEPGEISSSQAEITEAAEPTVTISLENGKTVSGRLIADYRKEDGTGLTALQRRDGAIEVIHSEEITEMRRTETPFRPMTQEEAGQSLLDDLGEAYHIHMTKHFVIAHNTSATYALWCGKLFESLYTAFTFYQNRRGFGLGEPEFPLMAVLLPNRQTFTEYARRDMPSAEGIAAYFNRNTNRIVLYDFSEVETVRGDLQKKKKRASADIEEFLSRPGAAASVTTIIHEATHQIAFNRGLFLRSGPYPLWAVEGLSMFFEVPDPRSALGWSFRGSRGKVNTLRLADLRRILAAESGDPIEELIREENFHRDPIRSYSLSWGLYYYLQTKEPEKLARYLKAAASRPPFSVWSPDDRAADFEAAFGGDRKTFLKNFYKFIGSLE
ncbi:MAG: DUF1570 domain-containing protein [Thermoguttaceae bacterium]|nr:DUF1570 domain-containing protein [Thermoguttaceae bacterium]